MTQPTRHLACLSLAAALTACTPAPVVPAATTGPGPEAAPHAAAPHWTYHGEEGPAHWAELAPENARCTTGTSQAPVDVPAGAKVQAGSALTLAYQPSAIALTNNGHTAQVGYDAGSTMTVAGTTYELAQFHFHAPSEHRVNGKAFAMEAHFVHKAASGDLAVLGVLMDAGDENAFLAPWWSAIPAEAGEARPAGTVNAADALPADLSHYTYAGSLTTPPCSENVTWVLLKSAVTVSYEQAYRFASLFGASTARPVQDLNGRLYRLPR